MFGLFRSGIRRRFARGRLRYEEAVLEVGEEVYVLGDTDRSGCFRRKGWFGGSKGGGFLLISDRSQAGLIFRSAMASLLFAALTVAIGVGAAGELGDRVLRWFN